MTATGFETRGAIRHGAAVSEAAVARMAKVTVNVLRAWEIRHDDVLPCHDPRAAAVRLADVYAALMWIAGGGTWPSHIEDGLLQVAVEKMRS